MRDILVNEVTVALVCLNQDEDVIDADSQDKEGNYLDDNEGGWLTDVTPEPKRSYHWEQNYQDATESQCNLGVNLELK